MCNHAFLSFEFHGDVFSFLSFKFHGDVFTCKYYMVTLCICVYSVVMVAVRHIKVFFHNRCFVLD